MKFIQHPSGKLSIAELDAPDVVLSSTQQFLQMLMDSCAEAVIVHQKNINENFFHLQSGLAGEMLQKVVNYKLRLAIVGEFSSYESQNLKDFIAESNRANIIVFVNTVEEAIRRLAQ